MTGIVTKPGFLSPVASMPFLNSVIRWGNVAYDMYKIVSKGQLSIRNCFWEVHK